MLKWIILYAKWGLPLFLFAWGLVAAQKELGDGGDGDSSP